MKLKMLITVLFMASWMVACARAAYIKRKVDDGVWQNKGCYNEKRYTTGDIIENFAAFILSGMMVTIVVSFFGTLLLYGEIPT